MYLILRQRSIYSQSMVGYVRISSLQLADTVKDNYISYFTDDMHEAREALEDGARVYKLDSLTELKKIEVTYQEVTMETENG